MFPYLLSEFILFQTIASLKGTEVSLSAMTETRDSVMAINRSLEKSIDTLKTQVHEEVTTRKLTEQRVEGLRATLEDNRTRRVRLNLLGNETEWKLRFFCDI